MKSTWRLVVLVFILALLGVGLWLIQEKDQENILKQEERKTIEQAPDNKDKSKKREDADWNTNIDTSNWKTYRSKEYGFEVKYPGDVYHVNKDLVYDGNTPFEANSDKLREQFGDLNVYVTTLREYIVDGTSKNDEEKVYNEKMTWSDAFGGQTILLNQMKVYEKGGVGNCSGRICSLSCHATLFTSQKMYIISQTIYGDSPPDKAKYLCKGFLAGFKLL